MSNFGFVYILTNKYMPDVCKIGYSDRSPHTRAEELSKSTGVPCDFDVLCYIEVDEAHAVEQRIHRWLENYRISSNREFFYEATWEAVLALWWWKGRISFVVPHCQSNGPSMLEILSFDELDPFVQEMPCGFPRCMWHSENPFEEKPKNVIAIHADQQRVGFD